ncbi:type I restriction-modification system subunit M [Candidatus Endoriftia persephone]|jgi:type I restriction enzyme M protein|uniref:site-specific DNA-methyltransferase (adenine-specific) n=2 Tax=Gammaproteobacteria TaxID=1236 RepID=G2DHE4_9GAMM|nr:class I SAM-dependent DNA methyltransferase [Candidatus Endoriftia persephone]EGV49963.1 putative type I restriction-modification system, M subunit [endosymbiont of Riftia pachyptila (vent Ph05)]USF89139.1 type I restriction-modification system subunit M [Candidatus Endoriftia persephone]
MDHLSHNKIVSFIWSIADDCLRDVYVRGKYRDVILPMFVLRRLDCLLEGTKDAVMEEVKFQRDNGFTELDPMGLKDASGYVFYNTSPFTLQKIVDTASNNRQQLEANFKLYLDGFSPNVREIVDKFDLLRQAKHMAAKDVLYDVLDKFVSRHINLSPVEAIDPEGRKLPPLTNLGMGYVFEELIRKFNEENNEEAGEHFTPREVIHLMTHLLFDPVQGQLPPTILIYDPACGSGGMLTESQNYLEDPDGPFHVAPDSIFLYGKEINDETYAICKSDMMIKGNNPENIKNGSTLATNEFAGTRFDFMLSNPPYGKSWKADHKAIVDGKEILDSRFEVVLTDFRGNEETVPAIPRSSDGQLLFLMEMVDKMKSTSDSPLGSRIASVHNGSSLFTGDAGSGESNIRRYIIENDLLEAIIQLPNNLFYNTGITTYIWVLTSNKAPNRKGKVQLIDASKLYRKLRKNLGDKNCEFAPEHIQQIVGLYTTMADDAGQDAPMSREAGMSGATGISRVFHNDDFGYYKVTIERPSRKAAQFTPERVAALRFAPAVAELMEWAYERWGDTIYDELKDHKQAIEDHLDRKDISLTAKNRKLLLDPKAWKAQRELMQTAEKLMEAIGQELHMDFNIFRSLVEDTLKLLGIKLTASEKNQIYNAVSWREDEAEKVIKRVHKLKGDKLEKLLTDLSFGDFECTEEMLSDFGYWHTGTTGEYIEYETDSDLRDTENVPLKEDIHTYFLREVRPHVDEAWINLGATRIGYEISFNKYFYRHKPLRSLEEVTRDILMLEAETEGLLRKLVSFGSDTQGGT